MRIEGKFYLNDYSLLSMALEENSDKCQFLYELADVMNPPIFKRQFCKETERSVQYFQSSDVPMVSERSNVFVLRKQAEKIDAIVKENDILVTGFGTIGNVRLVTELQDGTCYANNVARIKAKENVPYGFLYAFMASKYANAQLNKNASGSVVRYIEAPGVKRTLVPIFPQEKQEQIHNLITEAAQLRVEANRLLEEAVEMLSNFIGLDFQEKEKLSGKVSLKEIYQSLSTRIDPPTFINNGVKAMEIIRDSGRELVSLSEIDGITVYRPGIFKRNYVEKGLPYIKGSELFNINPFVRCDNLSKTKTPFVDEMALKENQILITCAGSCGLVKVITKEYEEREAIGSQDIIRLQSENVLFTSEYLFVYLQLPFVYDYIQSMKYGSVIERIEPFHVQSIPVVVPTEELSANITSLITNYKNNVYQAFSNENQAISLVENEIALWQS
jgi:restriction endonuclease S subunit